MARAEFAQRRRRLVESFDRLRLEAALISSPVNVRYLTGFTGSNSLLIVAGGMSILFTDPRYETQVHQEADASQRKIVRGPLIPAATAWLQDRRLRRIGYEGAHLTCDQFHLLDDELPKSVKLNPLGDVLARLRMVKSASEIYRIRRSIRLNSEAFDRALHRVRPSVTEKELAAEIDYQMRLLGAEESAFETIVAGGRRSALPHARPTNRPLRLNELVLIDMGSRMEGYTSDMTRVLHLGEPSRRTRFLYDSVLEAQLAAVAAIRPGVTCGEVDSAARKVLKKAGLADRFVHSTGHGLGLEIHEPPRVAAGDETILESGMVITVEPGVYLKGFGGIRIEDTVLVTSRGHAVLTPTTKELRVV